MTTIPPTQPRQLQTVRQRFPALERFSADLFVPDLSRSNREALIRDLLIRPSAEL
jgi:hypothetical protein